MVCEDITKILTISYAKDGTTNEWDCLKRATKYRRGRRRCKKEETKKSHRKAKNKMNERTKLIRQSNSIKIYDFLWKLR